MNYHKADSEQLDRLLVIQKQAFITGISYRRRFRDTLGAEHFRVVSEGGKVQGGLAIYPTGQYFGGKRVSMAGIAAVAVPPEARGRGAATCLMHECVRECASSGYALSSLYPAVLPLYQRSGYELGGWHTEFELPLNSLRLPAASQPPRELDIADRNLFEALYHQAAAQNPGWLDRHEVLWQRVLDMDEEQCWAVGFGTEKAPEGYIVLVQEREQTGTSIEVQDWVCLTERAWRDSMAYLASYGAQVDRLNWVGGNRHIVTRLLPVPTWKVRSSKPWFLRLLNVKQAMEERGWPLGVKAILDLDLQDKLIPDNQACWQLHVEQGSARLLRGGQGKLRLDIGALASLYSGVLSAEELSQEGRICGDTESLALATRLFAGPEPWMPDAY